MTVPASPLAHRVRRPHRRPRRGFLGGVLGPAAAVTMACAVLARFYLPQPAPSEARPVAEAPRVERAGQAARTDRLPADPPGAAPARLAWMLDPTPILGSRTGTLSASAPPPRAFAPAPHAAPHVASRNAPAVLAAAPPAATAPAETAARKAPPVRVAEQSVPLPVPRPAELRPEPDRPRTAARQRLAARAQRQAAQVHAQVHAQADAAAERSFFDAVFGTRPAPESRPEPALAYASLERDPVAAIPRRTLVPEPSAEATAIYDISARTVTLPSGEVLEAHSGLGPAQDNPKLVHQRMRGATPPGTYLLTEREALFHGVRAIRLNPVGGAGAIHNRTGILAHTYMLGPSGASNGCVVFRNYDRFLQAFLRGEVRRLVVVAGSRQDRLPAVAQGLFGR